jgi:hypothetical protein
MTSLVRSVAYVDGQHCALAHRPYIQSARHTITT